MVVMNHPWRSMAMMGVMAFLLMASAVSVSAQAFTKALTLEDLSKEADTIYIAKCTKSDAAYVKGNIVSHFTLKPTDVWKGTPALSSKGELSMDQMGGSLEDPLPITQLDLNSISLKAGDEVLLFTKKQTARGRQALTASQSPIAADSPQVVGGRQGAFSVIHDSQNGCLRLMPGTSTRPMSASQLTRALAAKDKADKLSAARALSAKKTATANRGGAASGSASSSTDKTLTSQSDASEMPIKPLETVDDVRNRVLGFVNKSENQ